jgi:hypothetical protein
MFDCQRRVAAFARVSSFLVAFFLSTLAMPAFAAELRVFIDRDNNMATGCDVATISGVMHGVEHRFITTIDTTVQPPLVTGVTREDCAVQGTSIFTAPAVESTGGWNVGVGNGIGNADVIETALALPGGATQFMRLGFVYIDVGIGQEGLIANPGGAPFVLAAFPLAAGDPGPIPALSSAMLAVLVILIGVVAYIHIRRSGIPVAPLAVVALVLVTTMSWAAIVLDGLTGDWAGILPIANSAPGTAPDGADIYAVFARVEGGTLFVRADVKVGHPPRPVADAYTATAGTPLVVSAALGLLSNDARGTPAAVVTSYGAGSLGGLVTGHSAGAVTAFGAGGSITVSADGGVNFTPPVPFTGVFTFLYRVTNINGTSDATVTIGALNPPAITSAASKTFNVGVAGTFTVTATGDPTPTLALGSGTLPTGVTFNPATGVLSGTAGAGTSGTYPLVFTAANGVSPFASQNFTLTVTPPTAITSANATTFTLGTASTFSVTTSGIPTATTVTATGALPAGVTFTDNGNGTATLAGTPTATGIFPISITASNGASPSATQAFTLTVKQPPTITSANNATFILGATGTFTVTTSGFPAPTLTRGGVALPAGVTFVDNGNGTGTLAGTPTASGSFAISFTAANGTLPNATQGFTLNVFTPASITSANGARFIVGTAGTFTVTTSGIPTAGTITAAGSLPAGVTFTNNGNGTATIAGTPGVEGVFPITFTAINGVVPNATQTFTLTVADAHAMAFVVAPDAVQANGLVLSSQPAIQLDDGTAAHLPVTVAGVVITATVTAAPGSTAGIPNNTAGFTRTGTVTATTDANGLATFTNLGILSNQGGLTGRITFSVTAGTPNGIPAIAADVVVMAGAPLKVQRFASVVLATVASTPLPGGGYPRVRILDAGNSPVPNASGASVSFSVIGGSCSTPGNAPVVLTTTDANGVASLSSSDLTVPIAGAGSCLVRATSSLAGSPIDFPIVVAASAGSTWLGAFNNDWTAGSNWLPGGSPAAGANIFVPRWVPNSPVTAAATTVSNFALEAGASFNVTVDVLTINGVTSAGIGSSITAASLGSIVFHGATTALANLTVAGATVQFDNNATMTGALVTTGIATVRHTGSGRVLTIGGSLVTSAGTTLSGLSTVTFTGPTFPVYGSSAFAGAPAVTQIAANMSVPSGVTTTVARDLTVSDAALTVNGNATVLNVGGSLDVTSSTGAAGEVLMTFGTPTLIVGGTAKFRGKAQSAQGLTAGTLELLGNFIQQDRTTGSHGEFEPGPNFLVKFTGGGSAQTVSFDHPGVSAPTQSYFTNVLVVNQGGVSQSTHVYINFATMTIGGPPAMVGSPAMWTTMGNTLFVVAGGAVQVTASGLLTVPLFPSRGTLDLTSGTCTTFNVANLDLAGTVLGGPCTVDTSLMP